jgi:hypothetical protein
MGLSAEEVAVDVGPEEAAEEAAEAAAEAEDAMIDAQDEELAVLDEVAAVEQPEAGCGGFCIVS